jgi:hypothetical protein
MKIPALFMGCGFLAMARAENLAGDEALSKVLIDGEDWQWVADGLGSESLYACSSDRIHPTSNIQARKR